MVAGFGAHDGRMETTNQTRPAERTTAPFGDDDPRTTFGKAVALGSAVIDAVRPDQLGGPTPCSEFDVRTLLGHMVTVMRRVAVVGQGGNPLAVPFVSEVADGGHADAWRAAAHDVMAVWTDDAVLARTVTLPWTSMTGAEALEIYANEVSVHVWDLARATGQRPVWDDDVLRVALAAFERALPPDADRSQAPFDPVVPVRTDAPVVDRLVAATGRRPDWSV
jgi:uncharacterized protein (TIGR03086 family)